MTLTSEKTIGEIAAESPAAIPVLEKYGVDYCCGGARTIEAAAEESGVPVEILLKEIDGAAVTSGADLRDWRSASLGELVQHILEKHHAYLSSELPLLEEMIAKVLEAHHARHSASLLPLRRIFQHLKQELESHMKKEEGILFPAILKLETASAADNGATRPPFGSFSNPVRVMEQEHESAGWALDEMREITGNYTYPPDACETYRALFQRLEALEVDMHTHIHLENNILFPRAMELERRS